MLAQDETGTAVPVAIETVEAGDLVWSRDEHTGEEGFKQVVRLFRNEADMLVDLSYTTSSGSGTLTGTEEHPFWSVTRGTWVAMAALDAGEQLLLTGGLTATVTTVEIEHLPTPVTVYNFEVADRHTYHVGTAAYGWVWVHNKCTFHGGAYDDLSTSRKVHRHHMPADAAMHVTTRGEGPSIQMLAKDHRRTSSYGNPEYVHKIEDMLNKDQWREAFAKEIKDVRRVAREAGDPRRYNGALREMMDYARKLGIPNLGRGGG